MISTGYRFCSVVKIFSPELPEAPPYPAWL